MHGDVDMLKDLAPPYTEVTSRTSRPPRSGA